ncbi:hypothetical protein KKG71_03055 [Patescibacteria group bacterium]|nr:hypothetical protein [Patescibacteria group bacterium]
MITPNKVISIKESALGLVGDILTLGPEPIEISKLYNTVSNKFKDISQFLLCLDLLYVLGRVEINFETGILYYAS